MASKGKAPDAEPGTTYSISAPAREIVEQVNLQVPSEFGGARQAVVACFNALDDGGNNPTTVHVNVQADSITVAVSQTPYVHGA